MTRQLPRKLLKDKHVKAEAGRERDADTTGLMGYTDESYQWGHLENEADDDDDGPHGCCCLN